MYLFFLSAVSVCFIIHNKLLQCLNSSKPLFTKSCFVLKDSLIVYGFLIRFGILDFLST